MTQRIPVIIDTDIGTDIDDTWALALALRSPELDVKMVVTDTGNTRCRAKIAARLLEVAGRADIPIGVGIHLDDEAGPQAAWVDDYHLSGYAGTIYENGVSAMVDCMVGSPEPVTLVCIGPLPNIEAAPDPAQIRDTLAALLQQPLATLLETIPPARIRRLLSPLNLRVQCENGAVTSITPTA